MNLLRYLKIFYEKHSSDENLWHLLYIISISVLKPSQLQAGFPRKPEEKVWKIAINSVCEKNTSRYNISLCKGSSLKHNPDFILRVRYFKIKRRKNDILKSGSIQFAEAKYLNEWKFWNIIILRWKWKQNSLRCFSVSFFLIFYAMFCVNVFHALIISYTYSILNISSYCFINEKGLDLFLFW